MNPVNSTLSDNPTLHLYPNRVINREHILDDTGSRYRIISHERRDHQFTYAFKFEIELTVSDAIVMGCLHSAKLVASCEYKQDFNINIIQDRALSVKIPPSEFYFTDDSIDKQSGVFCKRDGILTNSSNKLCNSVWYCTFTDCIRYLSDNGSYNKNTTTELPGVPKERLQYSRVLTISMMVVKDMTNKYFIGQPCTSNLFSIL